MPANAHPNFAHGHEPVLSPSYRSSGESKYINHQHVYDRSKGLGLSDLFETPNPVIRYLLMPNYTVISMFQSDNRGLEFETWHL